MSAPSFSSFPPSFSSFPDLEPAPSKPKASSSRDRSPPRKKEHKDKRDTKDKDKDKEKDKREKEKEKEKSDKKKHRRHHKDRDSGTEDEHRKKKSRKHKDRDVSEHPRDYAQVQPFAYEETYSPLDTKTIFYSDRKGDPLNITYGGIHRGDVPKYHLVARGRKILGLPVQSVVHRGLHSISVDVGGKRKMPSLTDSGSRHLLKAPPKRRLLPSAKSAHKYEEIEGFLRISSHRHKDKDDEDPSYRNISGEVHESDSDTSSSSEDEGEGESSGDESDTTPETSLQATLRSLEEQLAADPSSIPTWLSLLAHTLSTIPPTSKNASKARAEISESILRRALSAHPLNARSKRLRIKYLQAGEEIWHENKLKEEWEEAVKVGGVEIWMEWLDWRVRKGEGGMDGVVQSALRVLAALGDDEIGKLRVLWRVGNAFRDAGYIERATALFQAEAELIFNAPPHTNSTTDQLLDSLEEYWESEVPRFGEPNSIGWSTWLTNGRPEQTNPPSTRKFIRIPSINDPYTRWASEELTSDRAYVMPTRTFDEDETGDPYATILFSDIRPLLFPVKTHHAKRVFRLIWLSHLGLHIPGFVQSLSEDSQENTDDRWAHHHLRSTAYLSSIFPSSYSETHLITADSVAGVLVGRQPEYTSAFGPVKSWGYGALEPLETAGERTWTMWTKEDVQDVNCDVVRELFRQCKLPGDDHEWDVLSVAFEAAVNAKSAVKASKAILAKTPQSLPRWNAHARIERIRGRLDDARKVYQTIISASGKDPAQGALWWDWAEAEWLSGATETAQQVILRSTRTESTGGIAILRAKRHLEDVIAQITLSRWTDCAGWVKLRALLELLTSGPVALLAYCDSVLNALTPGQVAHESLTVTSLMLVYYYGYMLRNPTPPALLRERVERAIERYPSNTALLGLFLETQKGQGVWGRIRELLGEGLTQDLTREKDVARRVAEVWVARWQKGRWEAEEERTRSGLSAAVQHDRTRGSPVLWRVYLEFEIRCGQLKRAKKLLFRAVGECPLVKELYLLAFGPLRSVFSARELNDWGETMAERGLRMRRGLDEALEGWSEPGARGERVSEDEEDEIEYDARELRRLRPY
ncbi:DUF1740-domain-containing protein [Panus rudis PR-1116 ss-1]|nr:DUF1740-domain-containing protein [Panus rudis PR-1116 ss-1]